MDQKNKKPCRKCLLADIAPEEFLNNMRIYLQGLDESVKTEEQTYRMRLSHCEQCDNLTEGICRLCGCFVEYRAAIQKKACPDIRPRW
jgi:hypothetical protein